MSALVRTQKITTTSQPNNILVVVTEERWEKSKLVVETALSFF